MIKNKDQQIIKKLSQKIKHNKVSTSAASVTIMTHHLFMAKSNLYVFITIA